MERYWQKHPQLCRTRNHKRRRSRLEGLFPYPLPATTDRPLQLAARRFHKLSDRAERLVALTPAPPDYQGWSMQRDDYRGPPTEVGLLPSAVHMSGSAWATLATYPGQRRKSW